MNIQNWVPLGLTSLISLLSKELSRVFSRTTVWKHNFFFFLHPAFFIAQLVKSPPAMQETLVWFLGQEYLLEKG